MKWEENVRKVVPYVAGDQPNKKNMIKLNTNECPYPPAPGVVRAMKGMDYTALRLYPNLWISPGICIVLAVLAFNVVGDGLRDAFDPKARR